MHRKSRWHRDRPGIRNSAVAECQLRQCHSQWTPYSTSRQRAPHPAMVQGCAQLFRGFKKNRMHAQRFGRLEILGTIVDKDALLRSALRDSERGLIDARVGLAQAQVTGSKEGREVSLQIELADAIGVELQRFVIEGGHKIAARGGQLVEEGACIFVFGGLREHELLERFAREGPLAEKYSLIQVSLQGDAAGFQFVLGPPVPLFVIGGIERKALGRFRAGVFVPAVREDYAPDVPK